MADIVFVQELATADGLIQAFELLGPYSLATLEDDAVGGGTGVLGQFAFDLDGFSHAEALDLARQTYERHGFGDTPNEQGWSIGRHLRGCGRFWGRIFLPHRRILLPHRWM